MLEHIPCAFFWGEGFDESDACSAGIQVFPDTPHAGIKKKCACKLSQFLPLCAYSVLEHSTVLKKIEVVGMLEFNEKSVLEYSKEKC